MAKATLVHGSPLMLDHTPSAAVAAGDVLVVGSAVRIAHNSIDANKLGAVAAGGGVYDITKATGVGSAIADGADVYWDDTNKNATNSDGAGANKRIGVAVGTSGDDDNATLVRVQHVPN